jgi:hypothetical protein
MAMRNFADQALSAPAAASGSGHVGACSGLVDEDETIRIKQPLRALPALAGGRHVGTILFAGVNAFFEAEVMSVVEAPDRRQAETRDRKVDVQFRVPNAA